MFPLRSSCSSIEHVNTWAIRGPKGDPIELFIECSFKLKKLILCSDIVVFVMKTISVSRWGTYTNVVRNINLIRLASRNISIINTIVCLTISISTLQSYINVSQNLTILNFLLFKIQFIDIILLFQGICELFNVPEEKYLWVVWSIPCHPKPCEHSLTVLHKSHLTKKINRNWLITHTLKHTGI